MSDRRAPAVLVLLAGLVTVLVLYYWVHKPFTPAQARAIADTALNMAVAGLLTLLGGALGRWVIGAWVGDGEASGWLPAERIAVHAAAGWGVIGLAMLGLGVVGTYTAPRLWLLALAALLLLRRPARAWIMDLAQAPSSLTSTGRLPRLASLFSGLILSLGLLRALAPPLMWDALVYHLTLPKLYAQTHAVRLNPADLSPFAGMPQLTEMLYTAAFVLRGESAAGGIAAQALGWAVGAVLAFGVAGLAARIGLSGPLAVAVLFSSFSLAQALAWGYSDLLLMLLALAMLLALRQWRQGAEPRWLGLAGVLAGLAVSCKYTGAIVPLAGAILVVAGTRPRARGGLTIGGRPAAVTSGQWRTKPLVAAGLFLFVAGVVFSPWLLKNAWVTGNPVYPLLLPAADMDAQRQWFYTRPDLANRQPLWAGLIFWRATFLGVQGGNEYDASLGPLLALLPLALLLGWRWLAPELRWELRPLALFVGVAYAGWVGLTFLTPLAEQARLFFSILPVLAVLSAAGLVAARCLDRPALRISRVLNAVVALVLGLSAYEVGAHFVNQNPLPYLTGAQSAADYEAAHLGWYAYATQRLNALPPGAQVVFLWEARSFGCQAHIRCLPDAIIDRWWHLRRTAQTATAILEQWRVQGATHVLVYDLGVNFVRDEAGPDYTPDDWAELDALREQLVPVETLGAVYTLYALP